MPSTQRTPDNKRAGTWFQRFFVGLFAVVLALLLFWLLGFVVDDIGRLQGPLYSQIEEELISPELLGRRSALHEKVQETERSIEVEKTRQRLLRESIGNSQTTLSQLLDIQRLSLQQPDTPLPVEQQAALAASERLFLENQRKDQAITDRIVELTEEVHEYHARQRDLESQLRAASVPVQQEYQSRMQRHTLRVASLKIGTLIPLLLLAGWLFVRGRSSLYAPMIYALGISALGKTFQVMHRYLPEQYFKYLLIVACIVVVVMILVYLLRSLARPTHGALLNQYREAYEAFLCPVCRFPIRRGPLKFVAWTRRSIRRISASSSGEDDRPYTCPYCSTQLFETCQKCGATRHSLLPACVQCGVVKESQ